MSTCAHGEGHVGDCVEELGGGKLVASLCFSARERLGLGKVGKTRLAHCAGRLGGMAPSFLGNRTVPVPGASGGFGRGNSLGINSSKVFGEAMVTSVGGGVSRCPGRVTGGIASLVSRLVARRNVNSMMRTVVSAPSLRCCLGGGGCSDRSSLRSCTAKVVGTLPGTDSRCGVSLTSTFRFGRLNCAVRSWGMRVFCIQL